ncbi:MAG: phosphotransferase [Acidimicrobiales bacterium]
MPPAATDPADPTGSRPDQAEPTVAAEPPWREADPGSELAALFAAAGPHALDRLVALPATGGDRRAGAVLRLVVADDGAPRARLRAVPVGPDDPDPARGEADRLAWLAGRLPVPEVLAVDAVPGPGGSTWRVLATTVPTGRPASHPAAHRDAESAVAVVARAVRAVHDLPTDDCPFDAATAGRLAVAEARVGAGLVRTDDLAPAYRRLAPERLLHLVGEALAAVGDDESDVVVVHGDLRLDRILVDGGELSAVVGWHRAGVGDRYADLATVAADIATHISPQALGPFLEAYGLELPSLAKVDAHALLDQLT